jgi:hypothetical protein
MTKIVINIQARTAVTLIKLHHLMNGESILLQARVGSSLLDTQAATSGTVMYKHRLQPSCIELNLHGD